MKRILIALMLLSLSSAVMADERKQTFSLSSSYSDRDLNDGEAPSLSHITGTYKNGSHKDMYTWKIKNKYSNHTLDTDISATIKYGWLKITPSYDLQDDQFSLRITMNKTWKLN